MTQLISENKFGKLFKLKKPIQIILKNTSTPFGINKSYNKLLICWYVDNNSVKVIRHYEDTILNYYFKDTNLQINSKLSKKEPYPHILETQIDTSISSNDCIQHQPGEIVSYYDIKKGTKGDVTIECEILNIKDNKITVIWNIKKIVINNAF